MPRERSVEFVTALMGICMLTLTVSCGSDSADGVDGNGQQIGDLDSLREDPRISELLAGCPQLSLYDIEIGQTSVLMERLVDKLEHGQLEVLKRAKEELAEIGAPVVPMLQRLVERSFSNAFLSAYIENALGTASIMTDPSGRDLLLLGFDHPQESVRTVAVAGLRLNHAQPQDFERLQERLSAPEGGLMRKNLTQALFRSDRGRAEELVLNWLEEDKEQGLWLEAVPELCKSRADDVRARCAALLATERFPRLQHFLAAAGAAGGDADSRAWIEKNLEEGAWNQRLVICEALASTGWVELLNDLALNDPNGSVSLIAADHLAEAEGWNEQRRDVLGALLDSNDPKVRSQVLKRLVERRDPEAVDRAIAQLQQDQAEPLQAALLALQEPIKTDAELCERVRRALVERNQRELNAPLQDRRKTIKAIGILPTAWSADTLVDLARAYPGERLEGLRAHEWIMIHAGNSGDVGRARLFERLTEETDPLRRIDMIRAISGSRTDAPRELLLELAETGAHSELELLYIANRLARVGPSYLVAPRLKRVLFAVETQEVRRALSCLLWYWY